MDIRHWYPCYNSAFIAFILLLGLVQVGYGQSLITKKRTYANFQGTYETGINLALVLVTGTVSNASNATNGNVKSYSTLNVPVGVAGVLTATQYLEFTTNGQHTNRILIDANTAVTLKITFPKEILGLLSGIEIGSFTELKSVNAGLVNRAGYRADNHNPIVSGSSLLSLINGAGEFEITIMPNQSFNGVYMKLLGNGLSVALTNNFFHAYILENGSVSCIERDKAIDKLSGVRAGGINLLNATGSVTNPWGVVDGSGPMTLNLGTQVLSEVFHTTIFNTASRPNQVAKVVIQNPGGGLLNLNLLTGLKIQPFLGNTPVGTPINESQVLSLRLLPGPEGKNELMVPVAGSFDRIEIKMGGVAGALGSLIVHEVSRTFDPFLYPAHELDEKLMQCESVDLKEAILNYQPMNYDYNYYTVVSGGVPMSNSIVTESGTYYIEAVDKISGCSSARIAVEANVLPLPGKPHLTITDAVNE